MRILITGGVKSGKSKRAVDLALDMFKTPRTFLATAEAFDDEMAERIARHKESRSGLFETIEEPVYMGRFAREDLVLDCVTIWINNIMHYDKESEWEGILDRFLSGLGKNAVIVTNETGLGNIPEDAYSRRYNRLLGEANIAIAGWADRVEIMVSGLPVKVK
jgi:adenosylcobinamide kinase / adenosylcobinamide-phosphate guanylyltransferase